jgi:hypothetical protein
MRFSFVQLNLTNRVSSLSLPRVGADECTKCWSWSWLDQLWPSLKGLMAITMHVQIGGTLEFVTAWSQTTLSTQKKRWIPSFSLSLCTQKKRWIPSFSLSLSRGISNTCRLKCLRSGSGHPCAGVLHLCHYDDDSQNRDSTSDGSAPASSRRKSSWP